LERVQALENARKKAEEEAAARKRAEEKRKQQAEEEARKKKEEKKAAASTQPAISSNESEVEFDSHLATIEVLSIPIFFHTYSFCVVDQVKCTQGVLGKSRLEESLL
jgi:hypothetical protein